MTDDPDPLWVEELTAADPARPLLSTGGAAAVVLSAGGDVALTRETRGGDLEWGGVYAQGIRLTGPWRIEGLVDGTRFGLPGTLERQTVRRSRITSRHRWGPVTVLEELFALPSAPGAVRRLVVDTERPVRLSLLSSWSPFLAPVLVEGVKPYDYELGDEGGTVVARSHGHAVAVDVLPAPVSWEVDGQPWDLSSMRGEIGTVRSRLEADLVPGTPVTFGFAVWGGLSSTLERHRGLGRRVLAGDPEGQGAEADRTWRSWIDRTPALSLPDDPDLERAYGLARGALRALYTEPEPGLRGLVAGYPWYSALWCRDVAWMLPAVLWLGDHAWARETIATVLGFQANAHIPLLGAEPGELPMQLSPGPVFLFGTSDTTLYYPALVARLLAHSGRSDLVGAWWPHLEGVLAWARARTDPTTGLLRHGGEAEEIQEASAAIGRVHYGFDAVDTTIWDSTDRRAHAIDVQVLHVSALRALVALGAVAGGRREVPSSEEVERAAAAVRSRYLWPEEGYLADSIARDGRQVRRLRPNALRAVSEGLLEAETARRSVARALRPDLLTERGMRTLSNLDPGYDPRAYHDGQVWPIATVWAAEAAYAVGDADAGYNGLRRAASSLLEEGGMANECYDGDRGTPFDSCFLLGFSVAPFLTVLFERLWGLGVDALSRRLSVRPAFPQRWRSAALSNLAVGDGHVDLTWTPERLTVAWSGPGPLTVDAGGPSRGLVERGSATFDLPP